MDVEALANELARELGMPTGRMVSLSKRAYLERHPDHVVLFNATIALDEGTRIWRGDLDLTLDEPKLLALANASTGLSTCSPSWTPGMIRSFPPRPSRRSSRPAR